MGYESIGGAAAASGDDKKKPHAVCVPCPAQGHINPMLKLAKLLHFKGFHVTFVNTEFNHNRLLRTHGSRYLDGVPSFRFEAIPDGIPPSDDIDSTQDVPSIFYYTDRECIGPFRELLAKLNHDACTPPVTCIVSDMVMPFTLQAAEEIGVPEVMLWTASALGLLGYAQYPILVQKGLAPLKDWSYLSNGHLDIPVDWVAAMEGITLKQMPSFIRTTNPDDIMFNFVLSMIHRSHKASAIIINTFTELEEAVLSSLSSDFPPLFTIGPLQLILNQIPDLDTSSLGSNLWMEDPTCLEWLDSQDHDSVVYVNFGSITVMTPVQLVEFAWGLANSDQKFLWIIRPDLVKGDSAVLPEEFVARTKDRGMLASWCDQERVLSHPAVGGFLTHNGWNSTLESICCGVPMICWPFFAEQQTNCWFCCEKWGIGMEMDGDARREQVEGMVRELMMQGQKRMEMKRRAMEWKALADKAGAWPTGDGLLNLDRLLHNVLHVAEE